MKAALKSTLEKLPGLRGVFRKLAQYERFVPPGHFASPIPSLEEVQRDAAKLFATAGREVPGIELHEQAQLQLLERLVPYYREMPFTAQKTPGLRYHFENPAYGYSDGILLHCMIRHLAPRRIIEVGSGFSSCMILDTNDRFFRGAIETTFIEPYPALLNSLLGKDSGARSRTLATRLQEVDLALFETLEANDILFIDSTHVGKIGSDVNRLFFDILPRLATGVHVHLHDIFFPFEYPKAWVDEGRAWNEAYLLRAFLQYNARFRVVLMNTFLEQFHEGFFQEHLPLCLKNRGGSIWLCKT